MENILLHNLDGDFFEGHIVTGDETWVHHYDPETKRQSQKWLPRGAPRPEKVIRKRSRKKVMVLIFWDRIGVLLVRFLRKGTTLKGKSYAKILGHLRLAIQIKRGEMWEEGVFLLHDNSLPHTARVAKDASRDLGFIDMSLPPYRPDLAPSDYYLFPKLKEFLRGKIFSSDAQVEKATMNFLHRKPPSFFSKGISALRHRWGKCVKVKGNYTENQAN